VKSVPKEQHLGTYYKTLFALWGRQHWWPAQSRFEVIVGAYLTQNTSWTNVERALQQLRSAGALSLNGIRKTRLRKLESLIRSSGYFRQKAKRLKAFVEFLDQRYAGSLSQMFAQPTKKLREELLALNGIGPETADSILLYGGQHPVFVVDAYTRRLLDRHEILPGRAPYDEVRTYCEKALTGLAEEPKTENEESGSGAPGASHPPSRMSQAKRSPLAQVFNEMHGLVVGVGKNYCLKSAPRCEQCPLQPFLPESKRL
jgi:endonuclease III related protein